MGQHEYRDLSTLAMCIDARRALGDKRRMKEFKSSDSVTASLTAVRMK